MPGNLPRVLTRQRPAKLPNAASAGVLAAVLRRAVPAAFLVLLVAPAGALGVAAVVAAVSYLLVRLVSGNGERPAPAPGAP